MKRRILSVLLLLCVLSCLALPVSAETPEVVVRMGDALAYAGDTVEVPIYVDIPKGASLIAVSIVISYPGDALTLTAAQMNTTKLLAELQDPESVVPLAGEGREGECEYVIAATGASPIKGERTIQLATLTFRLNDDVRPGTYALTLTQYGGRDGGDDFDGFTYTYADDRPVGIVPDLQPGTVTVGHPIEAVPAASGTGYDVTLHGTVNSGDLLIAALYSEKGQMKSVRVLSAAAELSGLAFSKTGAEGDYVRFLWVTSDYAPRCAMKQIPES